MNNGLKISGTMAMVIIAIGILIAIGIMLACAPPVVKKPLPVSPWGDKYFYSYEPTKTMAPGSVKITLAIVNPYFSEKAAIDPIYSKVAAGLAKSMAIDLDKIIIAKGMTITGPFDSLDMMTYPDKKNANLTLTPTILINVREKMGPWGIGEDRRVYSHGNIKIDGWVILEMRGPLSSEKIWIKKIEVGEIEGRALMIAEPIEVHTKGRSTIYTTFRPGEILYDGRKDTVANLIKEMYPNIMQTCFNYINVEEILILNEKAEEIRKLKRY